MNDDLHRPLDGGLPLESLQDEVRTEAEVWERLLEGFRQEAPPALAPPWLESKVMAEIDALPEPGLLRRLGLWLLQPKPVRMSPLSVGLATAALATVLLMAWPSPPGTGGIPSAGTVRALATSVGGQAAESLSVVYVQFALEAPGATSVAVTGDFDGWDGSHDLEDLDGDGVWTGRVPVHPGVHAYMFLVDGSTWMTDPRADRYADDGFGNQNAILAVAAPIV